MLAHSLHKKRAVAVRDARTPGFRRYLAITEPGAGAPAFRDTRREEISVINILAWIIVGGIAGWLAGLVVQGTGLGVIGDIIVGIVGALIGGIIVSLLLPGTFGFTGFNIGSLIIAFIGAIILLLILRAIGVGRNRAV